MGWPVRATMGTVPHSRVYVGLLHLDGDQREKGALLQPAS